MCYRFLDFPSTKLLWNYELFKSKPGLSQAGPARQYLDGLLKGLNLKTIIWAWAPQFANPIINSLFIRKTRLIKDYMITDVYST